MDLQSPSVLAQLPRPLHASTGKAHIGEVYSLSEFKKRKRYEVAVAVDGEAVNIYNIQTPKLVTSYAVPPQSSFSCQPCSLRRKLPKGSGVKRQTYVAVKQQIKSFLEESSGNGSSAPTISSSSFSVGDSDSPAVFLGIVPSDATHDDESDPFDVLAVHRDGRVRRLSPDLETQRWSIKHTEIAKNRDVQACFLLEFDDVRKALFKRRPDLVSLAIGDFATSADTEPSVLVLVSYPSGSGNFSLNEVKVQIFSVPAGTPSLNKSLDESQKLRHILTFNLPNMEGEEMLDRHGLHWYFHSGSAGLNFSFAKGFVNFDLSQYTPMITSKFVLDDEDFSSVMRISPQSVIGAGKSMVALYDTQYKSIHRCITAKDLPSSGPSDSGGKASIMFISYFPKLDIAVATKGNTLLAFDLGMSQSIFGSSKRSRDGLLVDAIGRGIGPSKKPRTENLSTLGLASVKELEKWNDFTHKLREYSKSKDADSFDSAVHSYFGVGEPKALPGPGKHVNLEMVRFLLSCIFNVDGDVANIDKLSASSSVHIFIPVWPKQTCQWLIQLGYMCPGNVEAALRQASRPRVLPPLPSGSFIQTIKNSDPSLERLVSVLQGPASFSPHELAYGLKMLINMARSCSIPDEETTRTLTNGEEDHQLATNGVGSSSSSTDISTLPHSNKSEATLQEIFLGLNTTLNKIHTHPQPTITSSIRSVLARTEIITLIHHLRLSLATGGYTSRFTENPPTPITPDLTNPPLSLNTIIDILSASIDAIGPSGWISAADFPDSTPRDIELIAEMKSEVSAALAGVQEATFLKGILREYLRYANSAAATSKTGLNNNKSNLDEESVSTSVRHEKLNGADLLVFGAQGEENGDGDASGKLLPLSLRASGDVSKTKVDKGQVVKRSKREIGYLRGKAAGKYTFEKLIL